MDATLALQCSGNTHQDKNEIIISITQSTPCDISNGKSSPKNMGSHIKTGLEGVVHPKKETIIWPHLSEDLELYFKIF